MTFAIDEIRRQDKRQNQQTNLNAIYAIINIYVLLTLNQKSKCQQIVPGKGSNSIN